MNLCWLTGCFRDKIIYKEKAGKIYQAWRCKRCHKIRLVVGNENNFAQYEDKIIQCKDWTTNYLLDLLGYSLKEYVLINKSLRWFTTNYKEVYRIEELKFKPDNFTLYGRKHKDNVDKTKNIYYREIPEWRDVIILEDFTQFNDFHVVKNKYVDMGEITVYS